MTTQLAFAFGVLAMVATTMLVVIVVGMVKVIRLANKLENLEQTIGREVELIHRNASDVERNFYSELNDTRRNFDNEVHETRKNSQKHTEDVHRRIDDEIRNIVEEIQNTRKHVDSRFDKFENKIMATTTTDVATTKKQLLKD